MTSSHPATSEFAHLRGKSLLIFDDALRSIDGHWYEHDRAIADMHIDLGVNVTIICHRDFQPPDGFARPGMTILPVIAGSVSTGDYVPTSAGGEHLLLMQQSFRFWRVIVRHLSNADFDCIVVPNALIYDAVAWCLARKVSRIQVKRLVLLFRFGVADYRSGEPRFARKLALWRAALGCHRRAIETGVVAVVTDSSRLVDEYAHVSGVRPQIISSPRAAPAHRPQVERPVEMMFATLGFARYAKGIDLFQAAIARLIERGEAKGMTFVLQWSRDVRLGDGTLCSRNPALEASGQVRYIDEPLSSDAYDALFSQIGCMVLPYRRKEYRAQISGVAVEAACAGIPIIYTRNTWIDDFVTEQGAGVGVDDENVEQLAAAIATVARDRTTFALAAKARSVLAQHANSPAAFVRTLWNIDDHPNSMGQTAR